MEVENLMNVVKK